tara:strand:- start:462 stop:1148 length:687 start_codon:yes stop_codon:yes gene_type:complete
LEKKKIEETIRRLCEPGNEEWNHQFCFPNDINTREKYIDSPGYNVNKWKRLLPIINALNPKDKTFLDIGCSDGFYSIEIAKMGAKSVTGTDLDELRIKRANFAKKVLGVKNVHFDMLDLYDTSNSDEYDVVIALGLLHRIPDMLTCLELMCKIGKTVLVEFKTYKSDDDVLYDHGGKTKSNDLNKLYKTPTIQYIMNRFYELGHKNIEVYEDVQSSLKYPRSIVVASK